MYDKELVRETIQLLEKNIGDFTEAGKWYYFCS